MEFDPEFQLRCGVGGMREPVLGDRSCLPKIQSSTALFRWYGSDTVY
jgi:hypothetical protein